MYVCMYTSTIYINLYTSRRGGKIFVPFYEARCALNRFCSIFIVVSETYKLIWGVKKLLHRNVLWRFDQLLMHIYRIPPYIHGHATIRTFDALKSKICLYVKPYLHDIYNGFRTKHTYIHFKIGYFSYRHFSRFNGKYHAN